MMSILLTGMTLLLCVAFVAVIVWEGRKVK